MSERHQNKRKAAVGPGGEINEIYSCGPWGPGVQRQCPWVRTEGSVGKATLPLGVYESQLLLPPPAGGSQHSMPRAASFQPQAPWSHHPYPFCPWNKISLYFPPMRIHVVDLGLTLVTQDNFFTPVPLV